MSATAPQIIGPGANPGVLTGERIDATTRARLFRLFDAIWATACDTVLWQDDEPDAPEALNAWLTARGLSAVGSPVSPPALGHDVVLDVAGPRRSRISVYVLGASGKVD